MRRLAGALAGFAAVLPLAGCATGPTASDAAAVTDAVGEHEDVVTVRYVDAESSNTEGLSRSLTVGVELVASPVDGPALATVLEAIAAPLPAGYRPGIVVSAKDDDGFADLTAAAAQLGLPSSGGLAQGELHITVDEIDALLGSP